MQDLILGIDGGGTKTDAILASLEGQVLGEGHAGPTNLTSTSVGAASLNLREAIRQSVEKITGEYQIRVALMGLAGMDTKAEHDVATTVFQEVIGDFHIQRFVLINDSLIALHSGSQSPNALVLISGTGSICYGRRADGQIAITGGMDYLLTDQGSGYFIGRQVLREAVRSYDGRSPKSMLEQMVLDFFRIHSMEELKGQVYNPPLSKIQVAALAPLCLTAATQGDATAIRVLGHATDELLKLAGAVVRRLDWVGKPFDAVLSGTTMLSEPIKVPVMSQLQAAYPQATIKFPSISPVMGALKLAQQLLE